MQDDIKKIIEDGVTAPSGENCQPWKFRVSGSTISIFNVPEADQSLYNSEQRGSYIAHGALIENIVISAKQYNYGTVVTLFPESSTPTHVADIVLEKNDQVKDPLYDVINERCTNRKDFTGEKLTREEREELMKVVEGYLGVSLVLVDDFFLLQTLGQALAVNERVLFENKKIHDFFYGHLLWKKEDEDKAGGFYIETLEFLPHQLGAVKLFKNWTALSILNSLLGISKKISKENGEKYARSGTFGAFCIQSTTREEYVAVGRSLQRVWLTATKNRLSLHPCNGTIYFMDQIENGGTAEFSETHSTLIHSAYEELHTGFGIEGAKLAFIFRIGKASAPTARSKRLAPSIEFMSTIIAS